MKDISLNTPLPVTLRAGDWLWILGLLSTAANAGDNPILDRLYAQVMEVIS